MARFIIKGRRKLEGTFRPVGNKNAALPMLAASVLTDEPIVLRNVPRIQDVMVMLQILEKLGVQVEHRGRSVTLQAASLKKRKLDQDLCRSVRSSILFAGPLAARHGRAVLFPPGGDVIGHRRLDTHFRGLQQLGMHISSGPHYTIRQTRLHGCSILLDEASVTATENVMMASTLAEGTTTIYNAACEPHIHDLGFLLIKMGARISGLGTNCIIVRGVRRLRGAQHTVGPDYIEVGSFLAAAAATGGSLNVEGPHDRITLSVMSRSLEKLGVRWEIKNRACVLDSSSPLRIRKDFGSSLPKIEDGTWPAFPSDLMSVAIVTATQSRGSILFFEKLFESRMYFVDQLISMGAQIVQCDPHRVVVTGPSRLQGSHISSPDIRAGMSLIIAALCARGESIIENVQVIDRGYEAIDDRLRPLGASIERIA